MPKTHKFLYTVFVMIWIFLAIDPKYPQDWLLENLLVFLFFPTVIWLDHKYGFTLVSLALLLIFGILHIIGAHYTYSEMPYFEPVTQLFGFERNHYDRVVHFLYGLLLFKPILEIVRAFINKKGVALLFTFTIVVTIATLYELLEWSAAVIFHPELGSAFLGTQGDIWDAQKDTLAAIIGALINIIILYPRYILKK